MSLPTQLNETRFVSLLEKLIGETKFLQNYPPKFVPEEDKAVAHVLEVLKPFSTENGGPLSVQHISYVKGRGNVIISYPADAPESVPTVAFVGSHLDVVPASPETWQRDPFKLVVEGDKLYGRGTTDCLGHVALITDLFVQLAETKAKLKSKIVAVFIASEESSAIPDVGVDMLLKDGKLDFLKKGPVYWIDASDCQPCIGTASAMTWTLKVKGKLFHSGLPHKAINSIELGTEVLRSVQDYFYQKFPAHPEEKRYNFMVPSTMKPTQIRCSQGSLNQIPAECVIQGDIRLTPFYDCKVVQETLLQYVKSLTDDIDSIATRGSASKYTLPAENRKAEIEFKFEPDVYWGIACNIDSFGYTALHQATEEVLGKVAPYSVGGSLPLVRDLQASGLDVQITGFGKSDVYHGDNEYCNLSDMKNAFVILMKVIQKLDAHSSK